MSDITVALGKKIRSLRQARGWTQEQLAEYADLHVSYIVLLEKGANRATIETLEKLANAFLSFSQINCGAASENNFVTPITSTLPTAFFTSHFVMASLLSVTSIRSNPPFIWQSGDLLFFCISYTLS